MRSLGIPSHVASEMDRVVGRAYQSILGVGDLSVAQAKQLFIPMRDGGFGMASAELQSEPAIVASWASCAVRVTARVGLACVDDLSAEVPRMRVALPKLQARSRRRPSDLTRLGTTATTLRALALSRVSKATKDLRDYIGANSRQPRQRADLAPPDSSSSPFPITYRSQHGLPTGWQTATVPSRLRDGCPMQKQETRRDRVRSRPGQRRQTRYFLPVRTRPLRQAQRVERRDVLAKVQTLTSLWSENGRVRLQTRRSKLRRARRRASHLTVLC